MVSPLANHRFVHPRDPVDEADEFHEIPASANVRLPGSVDMRDSCPPIRNQMPLNSCSAFAIGGAISFEEAREDLEAIEPAQLFLYYNARAANGEQDEDAGANLRTAYQTATRIGACPEALWPYEDIEERFKEKPPAACYAAARKLRPRRQLRLRKDLNKLKLSLADGYPFTMGMEVFESMGSKEVMETGRLPMPADGEKKLGAHALMVVGYDDAEQWFICWTSFGTEWGDQGYFYMPYEYVMKDDYCFDFWTLRSL